MSVEPRDVELERMVQCPARARNGTCVALNQELGWENGLALRDCDECWSLGGLWGEAADRWRKARARKIVEALLKPEVRVRQHREVVVALTLNHVPVDKRAEFLQEEATRIPLMRGVSWRAVVRTWEDAGKWAANLSEFLFSMASRGLTNKRVDAETFQKRRTSCTGLNGEGKRVRNACWFFRVGNDGHEYCGACGCGETPLARLDDDYSKLEYPHLECPVGMPGFSNGRG